MINLKEKVTLLLLFVTYILCFLFPDMTLREMIFIAADVIISLKLKYIDNYNFLVDPDYYLIIWYIYIFFYGYMCILTDISNLFFPWLNSFFSKLAIINIFFYYEYQGVIFF